MTKNILQDFVRRAMAKRGEILDDFARVYLLQRGLTIKQVEKLELVESRTGTRTVWYFRLKRGRSKKIK